MLDIDEIRKSLSDMSIASVAKKTGLSFNTVKKVADGGDGVNLSTLRKLSEYFSARKA